MSTGHVYCFIMYLNCNDIFISRNCGILIHNNSYIMITRIHDVPDISGTLSCVNNVKVMI